MFSWLKRVLGFGKSLEEFRIEDVSGVKIGEWIPVADEAEARCIMVSLAFSGNYVQSEVRQDDNGDMFLRISKVQSVAPNRGDRNDS